MSTALLKKLEDALADTSDVYLGGGVDAPSFLACLTADLRANVCDPFKVQAVVRPPGFPDAPPGTSISGQCVARRKGYWLVYQPNRDRFCCFWGPDESNLGAHGVFGSPLYCWSA